MDADGTCEGYDIELTRRVCESVKIPVIASGGAGNPQHLYEVFLKTGASAALAASIFHYQRYSIKDVKEYLLNKGVNVRWSR
jgi:cyclase